MSSVEAPLSMSMNDYQELAANTAVYPIEHALVYPILGLAGESGELANKYKKVIRDKQGILYDDDKEALIAELGDCLWYISAIAKDLNVTLDHVANLNIAKLHQRKELGTLKGSGDSR